MRALGSAGWEFEHFVKLSTRTDKAITEPFKQLQCLYEKFTSRLRMTQSSFSPRHPEVKRFKSGEESMSETNGKQADVNGRDSVLLSAFRGVYEGFQFGSRNLNNLQQLRVLVVGAGGLGCEILKNLAILGFKSIDVIDMDTIDLTNLNRQFLFRPSDIGKPKAEVAARFVQERVPGVKVTPHYTTIEAKDDDFYRGFHLVICGLDSVGARRWINAKLVSLVDEEDPTSLRPLIDGGTEGLQGQVRVILPTITACYECSIGMITAREVYPLCTIANNPRIPEHCIEWASMIAWPHAFDRAADNDSEADVKWIYEKALERATQYKIQGVTLKLTQGVIKRIIPAIASTNAIIASACCTEAFKIGTSVGPFLDNYMMYSGVAGTYTHSFALEKRPDCPVCGSPTATYYMDRNDTLQTLIEKLQTDPDLQLSQPSLAGDGRLLYMQEPLELRSSTIGNLLRPLHELFVTGDELAVTDSKLPFSLRLSVHFEN